MYLETYLKAEKVVGKLREVEAQHNLYQDVIGGLIEDITISTTKNGGITITGEDDVRAISYLIDCYFFEKEEKIQEQLKLI